MNSILPLDRDEMSSLHKRRASAADLRLNIAEMRMPTS
jgi:hypothetical protein